MLPGNRVDLVIKQFLINFLLQFYTIRCSSKVFIKCTPIAFEFTIYPFIATLYFVNNQRGFFIGGKTRPQFVALYLTYPYLGVSHFGYAL